jgi:hypothetical protein
VYNLIHFSEIILFLFFIKRKRKRKKNPKPDYIPNQKPPIEKEALVKGASPVTIAFLDEMKTCATK